MKRWLKRRSRSRVKRRMYPGRNRSSQGHYGPMRRYYKPNLPRKVRKKQSRRVKAISKLRNKKVTRRDTGLVSFSNVNKSNWSILEGSKFDDIVTDLGALTVYTNQAIGAARVNNSTLKDDPNFNCYIKHFSKLRIRNNQSIIESTGETIRAPSTIFVEVYYCLPRYGVDSPELQVALQEAFEENGGTADLENRTQFMSHAPKFKKMFKVINFGHFELQPGDAREFTYSHKKQWWSRYEEQQTVNIEQKWEGFWLYRQQGQLYMNNITEIDAALPIFVGTRLTAMATRYYTYYYKDRPDPIKTRTIGETNMDTSADPAAIQGQQASAVDMDDEKADGRPGGRLWEEAAASFLN